MGIGMGDLHIAWTVASWQSFVALYSREKGHEQ